MAEQVVDIRERIEKMRTQIIEKTDDSGQVDSLNSSPKSNIIKKPEKFSENNEKVDNIGNISDKNTEGEQTKNNLFKDKVHNVDDLEKVEEIINKKESQKKFEEVGKYQENNNNEPLKEDNSRENEEYVKEKTERVSTKSYKNYHLKNTVDANEKTVEMDEKSQPFPQFSLNVNNPISWKLMLLIMLMQLLTNVMLVVVLYLK
mgnify:CR=1 FL=1|tara:strand:+ start:1031 stop:1639 length:609 start_codon:yes stop_codon:yes gene_type:complete